MVANCRQKGTEKPRSENAKVIQGYWFRYQLIELKTRNATTD